jgi:hypothetical protein
VPSLRYTECEIDAGTLESHADYFQELHAKISGRSGDFNTIAEPVSIHFQGLVGESLKSVAAENQEAWSSSMMACIHAYGMVQKVIEDVTWYEGEIEAIKLSLTVALGAMPSTGDDGEDESLQTAIVEEHNRQAEEAWEKLETKCETTEERLREGPTPENIRELIEAGHIGSDIAYATTGDTEYFHFDAETGEEVGEALREELEGGGSDFASVEAYVALLAALNAKAAARRQDGLELPEEDISFLESLHDELEKIETPEGPQGVLAIPGILGSGENGYSHEDSEALREAIAGAVLTLSDESLGGGFHRLSENIQDAVLGPRMQGDGYNMAYATGAYAEDLAALGQLMANLPPDAQGGERFSASLTLSMGHMMYELVEHPDSDPMASVMDEIGHSSLWNLLDVSTRNVDANHMVLTQEYTNSYYMSDEAAEIINADALEGLLLFQWPEDAVWSEGSDGSSGGAVTGLFDWITEDSFSSSEEDQRRAAEATIGLIDFMTDPEHHERLMRTGVEVNNEDYKYPHAGFGQYNGAITDSLAGIFESYIYSFAGQEGFDANGDPDLDWERPNDWPTWDPESNRLSLSPTERLMFLELIMTNDESAARVHGSSEVFLAAQQMSAIETGDSTDTSRRAATLQGLIDGALHNEAVYRGIDAKEVGTHRDTIYKLVADTALNAAGDIPLGFALTAAGDYYSDHFRKELLSTYVAPGAHVGASSQEELSRNSMSIFIVERALEEAAEGTTQNPLDLVGDNTSDAYGGVTVSEVLEEQRILTTDENGNQAIDADQAFTSLNNLDGESLSRLNWAMSMALSGTTVDWTSSAPETGPGFLENFSGNFGDRADISEQFESTEEQIKNRYKE